MAPNTDDLIKISPCLTADYLSQRLTEWFGKDIEYSGHTYGDETGKGDSYLSDVYRLSFTGKVKSPKSGENPEVFLRVILKSFPKNIGRRNTFRSSDFFANEINFYEKVLPRLLEFQSQKNMTNPFQNCPKVFASLTNGKSDFLALEDMTIHNYGSAARQTGIDYPHCQKILETFAKFHALSFAFKDQHPEEYEAFANLLPETYYSLKNWTWYKNFWKSLCICAIDAVEKEYPNTKYLEKIKEFATEKAFERLCGVACERGKSAVIGHGDSWTPNFLFKYKKDTIIPEEAMMIDFQLTRSASPILDVSFFIYACSTEDLRKEYYHPMLKYYYDVLATQIREMGSNPDEVYSWEYFMEEVKTLSFFGLGFSLEATPVIILEPDEAFDMDSITGTEAVDISTIWIINPIKSKAGRLRLAGNIIHAVDNGYI